MDAVLINSIHESAEKINPFEKNNLEKSSNERFALSVEPGNIANYTEKQYNSFGWARAAGAITKNEVDDLESKIQIKKSLRDFARSSRGEAIVEVNDNPHTTLGVNNVFAFVKGTKDNYTISRVVRFDAETETEMEDIKEIIYEGRTWSNTYYAFYRQENIAKEYSREDSKSFAQYQQAVWRRSGGQTSRGADRDNRQPVKYGSGYSHQIGENGEIIEKSRKALQETADDTVTQESASKPKQKVKTTLQKQPANYSRAKAYSKKSAYNAIKRIVRGDLSAKALEENAQNSCIIPQ